MAPGRLQNTGPNPTKEGFELVFPIVPPKLPDLDDGAAGTLAHRHGTVGPNCIYEYPALYRSKFVFYERVCNIFQLGRLVAATSREDDGVYKPWNPFVVQGSRAGGPRDNPRENLF